MLKVSIIIPIFKVEQYIERCVCSVLNQTYRELEVILIDDCSPDHSLDIAKQVVEKSEKSRDLNFVYLKHEKNRGLSAARNTGIKAATGDYFYLLDSDDEITTICIERLVSLAQKYNNVDIVQGNTWCNKDSYKWLDYSSRNFPEFTSHKEWIRKQFVNIDDKYKECVPVIACNRLFRREWFVNNNLWFKEGIIHEDEHWRVMFWKYIDSIAFTKVFTYNYYIREGSIVTKNKTKDKKLHSYLEIYRDYLPTIGNYSNDEIKKILFRVINIIKKPGLVADMNSLVNHYYEVIKEVKNTKSLNLRYKIALYYISLPPQFIKYKVLNLLL